MEQRQREDVTNGAKERGERTLLITNMLFYGLHNYRSPAYWANDTQAEPYGRVGKRRLNPEWISLLSPGLQTQSASGRGVSRAWALADKTCYANNPAIWTLSAGPDTSMLSRFILQDTAHLNVVLDFMTLFTSVMHVPDLSLRDSFVQVIPNFFLSFFFSFF